jgi:hypothetical protein
VGDIGDEARLEARGLERGVARRAQFILMAMGLLLVEPGVSQRERFGGQVPQARIGEASAGLARVVVSEGRRDFVIDNLAKEPRRAHQITDGKAVIDGRVGQPAEDQPFAKLIVSGEGAERVTGRERAKEAAHQFAGEHNQSAAHPGDLVGRRG